ncbi:hypothetical protein [Microvirga flavescens]|uniref:hypothetical protein n=1 Tax=Microvirga flavescens TaxID=2249811 RepID=UPI001300731A|nr:hypothetical protein [Microvirga flavescens]
MKLPAMALVAALALSGCAPTTYSNLAMACSEHVGKPISERIAALGPPAAIVRLSPTQVGYKFVSTATIYLGGDVYYTVNYMRGADANRTPIYPVTGTCRGMFVVNAPSDAMPLTKRIIIEVRPL